MKRWSGLLAKARPLIEIINPTPVDLDLISKELKKVHIPDLLREQLSPELAKRLNVRVDSLRSIKSRSRTAQAPSYALDPEPWSDPVDAEELFNEVMVQIRKEAIVEQHQLWVAGLEVFLTWVHDQMDFSPLFYITGPTKECGKTQFLKAIGKMVRRPLKTSSISPAALFRLSELYHPTFLIDDVQDSLGDNDFCLLLKAGHDPSDFAARCRSISPRLRLAALPKSGCS